MGDPLNCRRNKHRRNDWTEKSQDQGYIMAPAKAIAEPENASEAQAPIYIEKPESDDACHDITDDDADIDEGSTAAGEQTADEPENEYEGDDSHHSAIQNLTERVSAPPTMQAMPLHTQNFSMGLRRVEIAPQSRNMPPAIARRAQYLGAMVILFVATGPIWPTYAVFVIPTSAPSIHFFKGLDKRQIAPA
jgi:hypothetical protein